MSRRRVVTLAGALAPASALALAAAAGAAAGEPAGLGRPLTAEQVQRLAITAFPDGAGLPAGSGSVAAGRQLYAARCAACHGARGEGTKDFTPLAGGRGSLASARPLPTVGSYWPFATTLWDYIRRAMPYAEPGTLTVDDTYAVTAYVLHLNDIVDAAAVLDRHRLTNLRMPNRDGFVADPRPEFMPARPEPPTPR